MPIKSSIVLTLLIAVDGLEGGAEGGAERPRLLGGADKAAACSPVMVVSTGESFRPGEFVLSRVPAGGPVTLIGGVPADGRRGTGGTFEGGGGPAPLTARDGGGALGGGGVGEAAVESSPPLPFTHFLRSLS